MKRISYYLIFSSLLLITLSYGCLDFGVEYDTKNKLYPNEADTGCVVYLDSNDAPKYYGKRWNYLGGIADCLGISCLFAAYLSNKNDKSRLILDSK